MEEKKGPDSVSFSPFIIHSQGFCPHDLTTSQKILPLSTTTVGIRFQYFGENTFKA
jgi:hypothetical protein